MKKYYSDTEREFVFQWVDRWFQLSSLLWNLFRFDETLSPPPPTELDEINYQGLRFWFIDHETQLIPFWRDFYEAQYWASHPSDNELVDTPYIDECLENPFLFCYRPENLYRLVHALDIQSGIDIWEPSEHRAWTAMMELLQIDKIVLEFYTWICERMGEGVTTYETDRITETGKESRVKILVVDDEERYLEYVSRILTEEGYDVDTAVDGIDALKKIKTNKYNLLLTGICMPYMNGFELYSHTKKINKSLSINTIVVSGSINNADTQEFLTLNRLPYVSKPFKAKQLIDKINQMVR